jgi:hypothetical protein
VTDLATEIGGNANIGNNYSGIPSTLSALIPAAPTRSFMGETVETLSARLRVKHGRVNISGSATIGAPHVAGGVPAVKETIDGVYVSDGFGGNQGARQVHSDNGTNRPYDLGEWVTFPDLVTPTTIDGVNYDRHMTYLAAKGLTIPGPITLKPNESFGPFSDDRGNRITVNGATRTMEISGVVHVAGDISLRPGNGSGNDTFRYTGTGTLASTGSIDVHTNLLPASGFPTPDSLGLLARKQIELATGNGDSQLMMAGAFYAQEKNISQKQNEIAGTFVSSYYQMANVPHIYQVPKLAERDSLGRYKYLPPGLPGGVPKLVVSMEVNGTREREPR